MPVVVSRWLACEHVLIINATRRAFYHLRKDLRRARERSAGGSGSNNEAFFSTRPLADLSVACAAQGFKLSRG